MGIVLAAVAGHFIASFTSLSGYSGMSFSITAMTIVILGGLGSAVGSLIAGILLGVAETFCGFYFGSQWAQTLSLILLIIILLVKPRGLLGRR